MKRYLSIFLLFLIFGYPQISKSATNQDIIDTLEDIELQRKMDRTLDRINRDSDRLVRETERLRQENDKLSRELSKQSEIKPYTPKSTPQDELRKSSLRKFKNNECVIPSGLRQTQYILKIVSFDDGFYTTNYYSTSTEGWISKKTKVILVEDFSKKDGEYINEKYLSVTCPNFDSVLNINDYVKNMGKSK